MTEEIKLNYDLVEVLSKRDTDINVHLPTLYNLVVGLNARVVVELGAGQSTYVLAAAVKQSGGQLYSIDKDPFAHLRGWSTGQGVLEKEPRVHQIFMCDMEVVKNWKLEIDLLFIDTSHQYEHTKKELEEWTKWVRINGKIAMHDTAHKTGHAIHCRGALNQFLKENPDCFAVRHIEERGGLSILVKLRKT